MGLFQPAIIPDSTLAPFAMDAAAAGLVGTAGTSIAAIEMGDGNKRRTLLRVTAPISLVTTPDTAALAGGALIYTFPAGVIIVERVYGDVGLDIDDNANDEDTPEIGLGTVIASGADATLGASVTTFENLWGPHVAAGCDVIATPADAGQFTTVPSFVIRGTEAHTVHLNAADTWANGAGTADVFAQAGRFVIDWTLMPIEGL